MRPVGLRSRWLERAAPLRNDRGIAKIELGVASGKKLYDKRQDLRKRDHQRDMARAMSRRK